MAKKKETGSEGGYVVLSAFRSIDNWDEAYEPGDDVSHLSDERLEKLVDLKVVGLKTETPKQDA
ncbi:hypothetical protein FEM33_01650 [Dyadobacter flavalbus]|uniref:Uncharacterized protein n=1 Tax=Dyadobacter flavalbus TaxID=2579942 RepID=A0A5M8QYT3_9BACT|nr:hypothetical protein [Dyadobacter flavalbus]KAA6441465.1 hypothetical protein FEM33_01650 [Dyadobacter flavalbus]